MIQQKVYLYLSKKKASLSLNIHLICVGFMANSVNFSPGMKHKLKLTGCGVVQHFVQANSIIL